MIFLNHIRNFLKKDTTSRGLGYGAMVLVLLGALGLELTAQVILKKMNDLNSGTYDNSMWTVSQIEVDFQKFLLAVHKVIVVAPPNNRKAAIAEVVRDFDIYFSRVRIISTRKTHHSNLAGIDPLSNIDMVTVEAHLQSLVPLIDGCTEQGTDYFSHILTVATPILPELRQIIMTVLQNAVKSDSLDYLSRANVLQGLFLLTQGMAIVLVGAGIILARLSWQLNRRTVDFARVSSKMNKAIETSLDAVIITDYSGRISTFNAAAENMFGFTFEAMLGLLVEDLLSSGIHSLGGRKLSGRQIAARLARSANLGRVELTLQKSDNSFFLVEIAVASAVDSDGAPIFLGFLRDISKLAKADKQERAARFEAERSANANARFLAVMSHEMRTPLHGIIAALELLEGVNTTKESRVLRKIARDCAGSALEQIEEVLELALHDSTDVAEVVQTFFPVEVARIIVEQWQSLAIANQTSLTLEFDPVLAEPLHGNRRAFRSALANLIGNAIKFTQLGTITVRIYPAPQLTHYMRVEVIDTGIGIEPQHLTCIFEDFETISAPTWKRRSASGLGLGIVRRAVGLMGGAMHLESTFGKGSRFWFDIPQSPTLGVSASRPTVALHIPSGSIFNILVVDDNAINRLLLAQMLERLGHTVEFANDGLIAVEAAKYTRYDLILMDINMPGMNGVDATRMIRLGGASAAIPIIGITANALPQDLASYVAVGMNLTLLKPITSAALEIRIKELTQPTEDAKLFDKLPAEHPLVAHDSLRDLQCILTPQDMSAFVSEALGLARAAMVDANFANDSAKFADQVHQAAGAVGMVGAIRLHSVMCKIEDAARSGQHIAVASLVSEAKKVTSETAAWFDMILKN
jgi:PAS domain S-box-containing protein